MSETKTLTDQEILELKELNEQFGKNVASLGEIEIKMQLIKQTQDKLLEEKMFLLSDYDKLREKETRLHSSLLEKYGEGKINLESGKIETI